MEERRWYNNHTIVNYPCHHHERNVNCTFRSERVADRELEFESRSQSEAAVAFGPTWSADLPASPQPRDKRRKIITIFILLIIIITWTNIISLLQLETSSFSSARPAWLSSRWFWFISRALLSFFQALDCIRSHPREIHQIISILASAFINSFIGIGQQEATAPTCT